MPEPQPQVAPQSPQQPAPQSRTLRDIINDSIKLEPWLAENISGSDLYRLGLESQNPQDKAVIEGLGPTSAARLAKMEDAVNAFHMAINSQPGGPLEKARERAAEDDPRTKIIRGLTAAGLTFGSMGGSALGAGVAVLPYGLSALSGTENKPPAVFSPENLMSAIGMGGQGLRRAIPGLMTGGGFLAKGAQKLSEHPGLFGAGEGAITSAAGDIAAGKDIDLRGAAFSALGQGLPSAYMGRLARAAGRSGSRLQTEALETLTPRAGANFPKLQGKADLALKRYPPLGYNTERLTQELRTNPELFIQKRLQTVFNPRVMREPAKQTETLDNIKEMMSVATTPAIRMQVRKGTLDYLLSKFANPKNPISPFAINELEGGKRALNIIFGENSNVLPQIDKLRTAMNKISKVSTPSLRTGMSTQGFWASMGDRMFLLSTEAIAEGIATRKMPILGKIAGAAEYLDKIRKNPLASGTTIAGATREFQKVLVNAGATEHDTKPSWGATIKKAIFQ